MLYNDTFNRREYVVRVLIKVVKGLDVNTAVDVMQARASKLVHLNLAQWNYLTCLILKYK